jgi:L-alanine-DL-glutamate epimerase-like enolase superfamily enzyme
MDEVDGALALAPSAKAAIDMALHDLVARRLGVGLAALLGGPRRKAIPQSRIVPLKSPDAMAEAAVKLVAAGYRTVKLKLDGDIATDVARVESVRKAVGADVTITLDPNQAYNAKTMIRAFARMDSFDIALIEQPVPAADWAGLAHVTRSLPVPVEADESATTVADVMRLVTDRVVDVVNLKIPKLGGIRNVLAAAAICEAGGVTPRMGAAFGPALLQAASAHVACTFRKLDLAHELAEHLHLQDDPFTPLPVTDGAVHVPEGAGTGIDFA